MYHRSLFVLSLVDPEAREWKIEAVLVKLDPQPGSNVGSSQSFYDGASNLQSSSLLLPHFFPCPKTFLGSLYLESFMKTFLKSMLHPGYLKNIY